MDITVYLPDELGQRAKEAELPLSRMLRQAVEDELERRATVAETLEDATNHEVDLKDEAGRPFKGKFRGIMIAETPFGTYYLTVDGRVLLYDEKKLTVYRIPDPADDLQDILDEQDYIKAMHALGLKPEIDL